MPVSPAWKVKANGFEFSFDDNTIAATAIVKKSATEFSLLVNNRSVNAKLLEEDATGKKIKLEIEGETVEVEIKDRLAQMLDEMGFSKAAAKQIKEIKAPMPGIVLDIAVKESQEIEEGEKLLILGAMKMENIITMPASGVIKKVSVSAGQAVEKGQVLIELE